MRRRPRVRRDQPPPQPPATAIAAPAPHWTTRVNRNVVKLPPAAQEAVDNAFAAVSNEIQAVDRMLPESIDDSVDRAKS